MSCLVASGQLIEDDIAKAIEDSPIDKVEVRSALTCEALERNLC